MNIFHQPYTEANLYEHLVTTYSNLSSMDKIEYNDVIIDVLISKRTDGTEEDIIRFIDTYSLYSYSSIGYLERLLQTLYYLTVDGKPGLYKHCVQYIANMIHTAYPDMMILLFDHFTTFYNHKYFARVEPLQHIIHIIPSECVYHIVIEAVSRDAEHIIFYILHYLGEKKLNIKDNLTNLITIRNYSKHKDKYTLYVTRYTEMQSILTSIFYKDEVCVINTFLYGKRLLN